MEWFNHVYGNSYFSPEYIFHVSDAFYRSPDSAELLNCDRVIPNKHIYTGYITPCPCHWWHLMILFSIRLSFIMAVCLLFRLFLRRCPSVCI